MTAAARSGTRRRPTGVGALAVALCLSLAACGGPSGSAGGTAGGETAARGEGATDSSPPRVASSEPVPARWGFGRPPEAATVARRDVDVLPDGTGLPPGRGSVGEGGEVYRRRCAVCHGPGGSDGAFVPLVSAPDERAFPSSTGPRVPATVGNYWPHATSLFEYVRRAMPMHRPGTLDDGEVYAVVAWILHRNGIVEAGAVMDAEALPAVRMPARDRFVPDDRTGGPGVR